MTITDLLSKLFDLRESNAVVISEEKEGFGIYFGLQLKNKLFSHIDNEFVTQIIIKKIVVDVEIKNLKTLLFNLFKLISFERNNIMLINK